MHGIFDDRQGNARLSSFFDRLLTLNESKAHELSEIAKETGALVFRGQLRYPGPETGVWHLGARAAPCSSMTWQRCYCGKRRRTMENTTRMILMECDDCRAQWERSEKQPSEECPECAGTAVHQKVSDAALSRMRALLGTQKTTPERLKAAFAACTTGGDAFADAVLARAVEIGYIELVNDAVWRVDPNVR
jgi:hypothetical protein